MSASAFAVDFQLDKLARFVSSYYPHTQRQVHMQKKALTTCARALAITIYLFENWGHQIHFYRVKKKVNLFHLLPFAIILI